MWQNTSRSTIRPWAFGAFISGLVLVGCFYPLYALLRGELFPGEGHVSLIGAVQFQLGSRSGSGSIFEGGSGANSLLHSWLYYDSVLLVAGVAATVAGLAVRRLRPVTVAGAILILVALRPGGYLPAMYVVQVLPFFALAVAGVLAWTVGRFRGLAQAGVVALAVLLAAVVVAPRWYVGDRRALTTNDNAAYVQAAEYLRARPASTIVVDDVLWLDCVNAGYPQDRVIWFYKLDLDAEVAARLPGGWRDVGLHRLDPGRTPGSGHPADRLHPADPLHRDRVVRPGRRLHRDPPGREGALMTITADGARVRATMQGTLGVLPVGTALRQTIVVPTYNERDNIGPLLERLAEALPDGGTEIVFVDDSTDDTPDVIRAAAADCPIPVTVHHREHATGGLGRRGRGGHAGRPRRVDRGDGRRSAASARGGARADRGRPPGRRRPGGRQPLRRRRGEPGRAGRRLPARRVGWLHPGHQGDLPEQPVCR